ncbi:hypothetical protein DMB92_07835 [Campylobacter sp. MIT 99-7217]|uniref:energy transducer TonB n=1 Tax=Campylobacter sp. MIT 99-7217 TaxID=535091 RepID=UPI00115B04CC|nr:energy transducer TonB [Campylobacter sp. MIT 99-7217]TQR30361.1 hypothetical protein DMB92_07835 [Campylobacter sp. MIT 99-7217]
MNRKTQSFILTCLIFSPILLFAVYGNPFKIEFKGEDEVTLILSQFIAQGQIVQAGPQTPPAPIPPEETKEKKKEKKHKKKHKQHEPLEKVAKKKKERIEEVQESASVPPGGAQVNTNTQTQIGTLALGQTDNPFLREVKKAIDEAARETYPRQAIRMNLTGTVLLEFVWLHNKILEQVKIISTSGHKILDSHTLKIIQKAARNFPQYKESVRIQIPVTYNLTNSK